MSHTYKGNRVLKRLQPSKKICSDFFVWDVETNGMRAQPDAFILGCIYGHNFSKVIHSVDEFKQEFLHERYKKKIVFAHNAEYDINTVWGIVYNLDYRAIFTGSRFICASNGNCLFADSMNVYPYGVAKIGEYLGLSKSFKTTDYEANLINMDQTEVINGCMRDCEIVYDALIQYFETVGEIKITKAGLAMSYYRRNFQPFDIHYNERKCEYFFNSYFGGRTEAFYIGKCEAIVYDINSSYPYALKQCKLPNPKNLRHLKNISVKRFTEHYLKNYEGVAKVSLTHGDHFFGFLPVKINGKLLFPVGKINGWYNFNELLFGLEFGVFDFIEIEEIIFSKPMPSLFSDFIDSEFEKKKNAPNPLVREIHKFNQNTLYGKFGQRVDEETVYIDNIDNYLDYIDECKINGKLVKISPFNEQRKDARLILKKDNEFRPNFCIPVIPSYITSFARIHLLKTMLKYIEYDPLYCDTDSIFFGKKPPIEDSNDLGFWKQETKIVTAIKGLKNYNYRDVKGIERTRIKGVRIYNSKGEQVAKEIRPNVWRFTTLVKTKESLVRNIEAGTLQERTKVIKNTYDKRIVKKDGTTKPIKL